MINKSLKKSRQKIAIFFSLLSSVFILVATLIIIFLVRDQIEKTAETTLTKSIQQIIGEYEQDELGENEVIFQENQLEDDYSQELKNVNDQNLNRDKLSLSKSKTEAANFEGSLSESWTEFTSRSQQVYSRIILADGDIIYSSDLFEEYSISPFEQGFQKLYGAGGGVCIYSLSQEIISGSKSGDIVQVAQYCSFPESAERDLFGKMILISILLMFVTYLVGYFAAGFFLKPLEKTIKKTKEFTQNAYHELLTPLSVALSTAEASVKLKNYQEGIKSINEDLLEMRETLNLLSMNSLSEQESLLLKKINLSEIITSFLSKQQDQPIKSQIRPNVYQKANETGFKLILENLLSNAIKYSTANSEIKIVLDKNHLEITNQIANPKKLNLRKLFQRNYRGENQNDQDGNGIGLAIAKELCRAMKWRITAIKEEDRLRITITFR
jgi:hypothetical protein